VIEVAFNLDKYTLDCAHVAAHSLASHAGEPVRVLFLLESSAPELPADWRKRLENLSPNAKVEFVTVDNTAFRHCKSFFGSHATYLRIYAPRFAETSRLIYSDTDVVFTSDARELRDLPMNGATIALPGGTPVSGRPEQEKEALLACGRGKDDLYYGSGLAVIDTAKYLGSGKIQRCEEIARSKAPHLKFHEQTIWNCAFSAEEIRGLDGKWCQTPPVGRGPAFRAAPGIVHFAGSPKPWDLLGEFCHAAYPIWADAARKARRSPRKLAKYFDSSTLVRAWRIRRQYAAWIGPIANKL